MPVHWQVGVKTLLGRVLVCRKHVTRCIEHGWQKQGFMEDGKLKSGDKGWRAYVAAKLALLTITKGAAAMEVYKA